MMQDACSMMELEVGYILWLGSASNRSCGVQKKWIIRGAAFSRRE